MPRVGDASPLVSAIMPTYNAGEHLTAAIDSVLRQSLSDWELIVFDDGSTDETQSILRSYQDPRIRSERSLINRGRGSARNHAIRLARGRYIAPCDSDDVSLPNRFARQVEFLETHSDIDIVSAHMACFWGEHPPEIRFTYPVENDEIQRRFARGRMGIAHGACMLRSRCFADFGSYDETLRRGEDLDFFMRICRQCRFHTLPEVLYLYRQQPHAIALNVWLEEAGYQRFFRFRHAKGRVGGRNGVSYDQFLKEPSVKIRLYTCDALRYLLYWLRSYLQPRRTLR